jgi:lysophospholipase L1-like esterase
MINFAAARRNLRKTLKTGRKAFSTRSLCLGICAILLVTQLAAPSAQAAQSRVYVALGDSLAFGAFALPGQGYVPTYRNRVEAGTGANVNLVNLGVPGWKSGELLAAIRGNLLFRVLVANASVVTWNIGGNDFLSARNTYKDRTCGGPDNQDCLRATVATLKTNWDAIMAEILSLRRTSNTIIRTMDIYNPFVNEDRREDTWPNDQGNDFEVVKQYLEAANSHIAMTATANNIPYAQVYLAFNGPNGAVDPSDLGYIFFDGIHANGRGHRRMAELLGNLGYGPLF